MIKFNKSTNIPLSYMTPVSINLAGDGELLDLLGKANVTNVFIGIETPRKLNLKEVNKGQNVKTDLLEAV